MNVVEQKFERWSPLSDIPDSPCADFCMESVESGKLILTLKFSHIAGNDERDLVLSFSDVLATRTFWDGDAPVVGRIADPPRCSGQHSTFIWPLLRADKSHWLNSGDFDTSIAITDALKQGAWEQYTVLTLERSIDVLARGEVHATWRP